METLLEKLLQNFHATKDTPKPRRPLVSQLAHPPRIIGSIRQSVAYLQYRTTSVRHGYQSGIPELWKRKHNRGGGLPPRQWLRSSATFQSASSSRKTVTCLDSIIRAKHCLPQSKRLS